MFILPPSSSSLSSPPPPSSQSSQSQPLQPPTMIDFSSSPAGIQPNNSNNSGMGVGSPSTPNSNQNSNNQAVSATAVAASFLNFRNPNSALHGSFGVVGGGVVGPPPTLDLNEFPSLGGASINSFNQSSGTGRPAYVGMVKDNVTNNPTNSEFNIQSEDFPALPGSNAVAAANALHFSGSSGGNGNGSGVIGGGLLSSSSDPSATLASLNQALANSGALSGNSGPGGVLGNNNSDNSGNIQIQSRSNSMSMVGSMSNQHQQGNINIISSGGDRLGGNKSLQGGNPNNNNSQDSTIEGLGQSTGTGTIQGSGSANSSLSNGQSNTSPDKFANTTGNNSNNSNNNNKKSGLQITKDGHITNIPPGMLTDQYGMAGLVSLMQSTETNSNLFSLAIGYDIGTINLNLNSKERIYQSYPGPWNEKPLKPFEIDYPVPSEYLINSSIRDKLAQIKLEAYNEDLLFFLFYFFAGEQLQMLAVAELYSRDWRFHKDECVWITRRQGMPLLDKQSGYERGSYVYFDPLDWTKNCKEMTVKYDRLEPPPI